MLKQRSEQSEGISQGKVSEGKHFKKREQQMQENEQGGNFSTRENLVGKLVRIGMGGS